MHFWTIHVFAAAVDVIFSVAAGVGLMLSTEACHHPFGGGNHRLHNDMENRYVGVIMYAISAHQKG
jgi:hypothetical protein